MKYSRRLWIGLTGDVMLGRLVNESIQNGNYRHPWGNALHLLKSTDFNLINLETTLTRSTAAVPKTFNFKAFPDRVHALREAGVSIANLANNHILDFGKEGLQETLSTLAQNKILSVGAGMNREEAHRPVILRRRGYTIGILGVQDNEPSWEAGVEKEGTAYLEVGNEKYEQRMETEVRALKANVDVCIVSLHWGSNMRRRPTLKFRAFAHRMINAGVDILHGHSAHVFQGVEIYRRKVILYDCGDFLDDYRVDPMLRNDQSFFVKILASSQGVHRVQLFPIQIKGLQVALSMGIDRIQTLLRVRELSRELGTEFQETLYGLEVYIP